MAVLKVQNPGLDYLLDLDGEIFPMDNGYWTKFDVKAVEPNENIPHGIKYSLTLHNRNNTRVLGYDNAHGIKVKKGKFAVQKTAWDHKHKRNQVGNYEFESAGKLVEDFWNDVNKIMDSN